MNNRYVLRVRASQGGSDTVGRGAQWRTALYLTK
jgi:hypothetical protein